MGTSHPVGTQLGAAGTPQNGILTSGGPAAAARLFGVGLMLAAVSILKLARPEAGLLNA